jgi:hypothetical protein
MVVASNSRGILLLGAVIMLAAAAGVSTTAGTGWIIPMTILLSTIFGILLFSVLTNRKENPRGSTPLSVNSDSSVKNIESNTQDLPDPNDAGFDLPIL